MLRAHASTASNDEIYNKCESTVGDPLDSMEMLRCVTALLQEDSHRFTRSLVLVYSAALLFFMQAGFAMLCAGAVRHKNVQNTMLKNLLDVCGAALAFFAVGFAFAYGGCDETPGRTTFIGTTNFFLKDVDDLSFWLFQFAFSAASATIVAGTLAERCQMAAYLCYSVMLVGWVYPVVAHAIWDAHGFLSAHSAKPLWGTGVVDFAGSGVVHLTGGVTALFATIILGPRRGRFHDDMGRPLDAPKDFPGHSIALQMLGTFTLWFGWYGFNAGSALTFDSNNVEEIVALAGVNTTLSAGAAGITALFMNLFLLERLTGEACFDLKYAMNGSLAGLVAITGGCGVVEPWAAVITGMVAGLLYMFGTWGLVQLRLDDAVDAIPVHMSNGIWGILSVGLFAAPRRLQEVYGRSEHAGLFYSFRNNSGDATLLGAQVMGLLFIIGWVMAIMLPFFIWLDWKGWFRSVPLDEIVGLDTTYHGGVFLACDEEIKPEYVTAYQKKKEETLRRRRPQTQTQSQTETQPALPQISEAPEAEWANDVIEDPEQNLELYCNGDTGPFR